MTQKLRYATPIILREVNLHTEGTLLAGSVVDNSNVTSVGQKIDEYDFSQTTFNHDWENAN